MNLRRRLTGSPRPSRNERLQEVCPICGHSAERGTGRLIDPIAGKEICVRCGNEVGKERR